MKVLFDFSARRRMTQSAMFLPCTKAIVLNRVSDHPTSKSGMHIRTHISTPQVIKKHHIRSFLPFIYGVVVYYKDCNILPIFKSAIQILDSIGMKEMIIPAALFMGSSKAEGQKFNEAISLLTWAEKQIQGITCQGGQMNMPRRITDRIWEVFAVRPTDWGAGWEHVAPVMTWYSSVYMCQAPVQAGTRNARRMKLSGEGGSQIKPSPKKQCAYGLSERRGSRRTLIRVSFAWRSCHT
ncbi:hypothetical protein V2G26_019079 [Clonostachys chloroleuca]